MDLMGFIDALVIGPANMASNKIIPPTAIPAIVPISLLPVETLITTIIKKNVKRNSKMAALYGGKPSAGVVSPKNWLSGKRNQSKNAANMAPVD